MHCLEIEGFHHIVASCSDYYQFIHPKDIQMISLNRDGVTLSVIFFPVHLFFCRKFLCCFPSLIPLSIILLVDIVLPELIVSIVLETEIWNCFYRGKIHAKSLDVTRNREHLHGLNEGSNWQRFYISFSIFLKKELFGSNMDKAGEHLVW